MIAYYFRVIHEDGTPTGHIGLVCARDKHELLWTIDEFVDPYSVEICTVKRGGICMHQKIINDENGELDEVVRSEYEETEEFPLFSEKVKWRKPDWTSVESYYAR